VTAPPAATGPAASPARWRAPIRRLRRSSSAGRPPAPWTKARFQGLVIWWLVLLGLTCAVGELTVRVGHGLVLARVDRPVQGWLQPVGAATAPVADAVTLLGTLPIVVLGAVLVIAVLRRTRRPGAARIVAICAGASALSTVAKRVVGRVGPPHRLASDLHDYSWPSGHSTAAAALLVGAALLLTRRSSQTQRILVGAAAVLGALTVAGLESFSMSNWASDVVAGFAVGASWAVLVVRMWPVDRTVRSSGRGFPSGIPRPAA
jgi:membrane-associated phospholipid phosphatase